MGSDIYLTKDTKSKEPLETRSFISSFNLAKPLAEAREFIGENGFIASMPDMIHGMVNSPIVRSPVSFCAYVSASEEYAGRTRAGNPVAVVVHGGGLLTPERINHCIENKLFGDNNSARLAESEILELLDGKLSDTSVIPVFPFREFISVTYLPRRYAVVLGYELLKDLKPDVYMKPAELRDHPMLIARSGSAELASELIEEFCHPEGPKVQFAGIGNCHNPRDADFSQPQGGFVYLGGGSYFHAMSGFFPLMNSGHFLATNLNPLSQLDPLSEPRRQFDSQLEHFNRIYKDNGGKRPCFSEVLEQIEKGKALAQPIGAGK